MENDYSALLMILCCNSSLAITASSDYQCTVRTWYCDQSNLASASSASFAEEVSSG